MFEEPKLLRSSSRAEERHPTPDVLMSERDSRFLRSLHEFIDQEKQHLQGPEEEPDRLRHEIYRSVFSKLIAGATTYKRLLLALKAGYDDIIRTLQRRRDEARSARRAAAASTSRVQSLKTCQRRGALLRERISVLQRETAELQQATRRQKRSKEQSLWIPGLTVAMSEDPEVLDRQLKHLEVQRAALLDRRREDVPLEVKDNLDTELQTTQHHREQLSMENERRTLLFHRLRFVSDRLSSWEEEKVPLEELLASTLENIRRTSLTDDGARRINSEVFEHEEPTGADVSKLLNDHLDRFTELFGSAQYEEAALLAARSPGGVLRNLETMEMFKGVTAPPGSVPPLLLFFQALLMTLPAGDTLPAALSLQAACCALQHGATHLLTHAVTQNKLTSSEDLGDLLTEHAHKDPAVTHLCLTLATAVYEAGGTDRKIALSMCRRGLVHSAAEFMRHRRSISADDCMWILCHSPSLRLLQLMTDPQQDQADILSVGDVCSYLLADPQQQNLVLELLDSFVRRGPEVLEEVILQDRNSTVDVWTNISSRCCELNRTHLSQAILAVLLENSGTRVLTPDPEGARLMEHILL